MTAETEFPPGNATASKRMAEEANHEDARFREVKRNVEEARAALGRYVRAQVLRVQSLIRLAVLYGALGVVLFAIAVCVVASATVLLMVGTSEALATALGGRQWAGDLITGGTVVLGVLLGGYISVRWLLATARARTISSFEKPSPSASRQ